MIFPNLRVCTQLLLDRFFFEVVLPEENSIYGYYSRKILLRRWEVQHLRKSYNQ